MIVNTKIFGPIDVPEESIILFPQGLVGLPWLQRFVLIQEEGLEPFFTLQSVDEADFALWIVPSLFIDPEYAPPVDEIEIADLGDKNDILPMIIVWTEETDDGNHKTYANLKAPLLINPKIKKGRQVVIDKEEYPLKKDITAVVDGASTNT
ncbi:hypothetical protein GM182_05655 [bacterium 3DAC]|nr:flagellar assembly protein FliW [Dictyoglomota bacterium]UZN23350.1 hypothetical protein GM182_05655 [bacterium 3DAC]